MQTSQQNKYKKDDLNGFKEIRIIKEQIVI
jgi:hypothetical protein